MTDTVKIQRIIRSDKELSKLWDKLPLDLRREALRETDARFIGERLRRLRKLHKGS